MSDLDKVKDLVFTDELPNGVVIKFEGVIYVGQTK